MKARHLCAVLGVAIAAGTVTFMRSLVSTNDHQAVAVAERLMKAVPVEAEAETVQFALDYRPGGRVMQGPPMMAAVATASRLTATNLGECVVTKALFAQRRFEPPPIGSELTLIGRRSVHRLTIAGYIDWEKSLRGYPNVFVSPDTAAMIEEEWQPWEPKSAEELAPGFTSDAARNFGRAQALLLWAAALTALCLIVNSLFLAIEARRRDIAILRMVGATRAAVAKSVAGASMAQAVIGAVVGNLLAVAALWAYVTLDGETYPMGMAVSWAAMSLTFAGAVVVAAVAALIALKPALSVRPLEAVSCQTRRRRHIGMIIAFACGFGAFVAVEVWGASLMGAFVPSVEWPDAIVSILPGGVSSFDIEKLRKLEGVRELHELAPLQVNFDPLEELKMPGGKQKTPPPREAPKVQGGQRKGPPPGGMGGRGAQYHNVLLLGSDWLPNFRFVEGDHESAEAAIMGGDACVITAMMARARKLKLGDDLKLDCGRGLKVALKVAGVVDLNWHMVTSRGLVRGLNRMPGNTDGPAFVSFDTVEACDARPAMMVKMTHIWLDYRPEFLAERGPFGAGRIVEREIADALGLMTEEADANTVRLHSRDEVADGTLAHGVDIIGSMAKVPFIFIAVISLGFVSMLVATVDSRRREFLVLHAVGATRSQLARVLVGETLAVAAVGTVAGLFGGSLTGWLFTGATRAMMANWGLPASFAVPWLTVAKGAIGAIAFALVVGVPTSLALVRKKR